jgi:hypothetical protein
MNFSDDDFLDEEEDEIAAAEPHYSSLSEFVTEFFSPMCSYRLSPAPGRGLRWDPRWWRWPQVRVRLDYLWKTWEAAYADQSAQAMADWWLRIFDPTVRILLDGENGPLNSYREDMDDEFGEEDIPSLYCLPWDERNSNVEDTNEFPVISEDYSTDF